MNINDLVKYEYYYTKEKAGDFWMLYRYKQIHDSNLDTVDYTCHINSNKEFCKDDYCSLFQRITRKATPEEIQWLELCSKEGKFIEYNKIGEYMNKEEEWEPKDNEWVVILRENTDNPQMVGIVGKYNSKQGFSHQVDISINNCPKSYNGTQLQKGNDRFPEGYYYCYAYTSNNTSKHALRKALPSEIPNSSLNTMNKFEIGKYYAITNNTYDYFIKILEISDNGLYASYKTNINSDWKPRGYFSNIKYSKELTKEETEGIVNKELSIPKEEDLIGRWYKTGVHKEKFNNQEYVQVNNVKNGNAYFIGTTQHILSNCWTNSLMPKGFSPIEQSSISIPEYVRAFCSHSNQFTKDKIYKTIEGTSATWIRLIDDVGDKNGAQKSYYFIDSTKEEFDKQEYLKGYRESAKPIFQENISIYNYGVDPYQNEIIEIGDEVEVFRKSPNNDYIYHCIGYIGKILRINGNSNFDFEDGYCEYQDSCKLHKKANKNNTIQQQKPDISSAIQVGNDVTVLDVFKPKQSKLMDYSAFIQQSPKELSKISKKKYLTIN